MRLQCGRTAGHPSRERIACPAEVQDLAVAEKTFTGRNACATTVFTLLWHRHSCLWFRCRNRARTHTGAAVIGLHPPRSCACNR
jgi:hypothetical protein